MDDANSIESEDISGDDENYTRISEIAIERNDVFKVPLMWMMPDSEVDLYI